MKRTRCHHTPCQIAGACDRVFFFFFFLLREMLWGPNQEWGIAVVNKMLVIAVQVVGYGIRATRKSHQTGLLRLFSA